MRAHKKFCKRKPAKSQNQKKGFPHNLPRSRSHNRSINPMNKSKHKDTRKHNSRSKGAKHHKVISASNTDCPSGYHGSSARHGRTISWSCMNGPYWTKKHSETNHSSQTVRTELAGGPYIHGRSVTSTRTIRKPLATELENPNESNQELARTRDKHGHHWQSVLTVRTVCEESDAR
jgi:hypothetical protein